jgi:hypothetical protein
MKMGNEYIVINGKQSKFFSNEDKLIESGILPVAEVVYAIHEMNKNGHNISKFGVINGFFMFTDNVGEQVKVWH